LAVEDYFNTENISGILTLEIKDMNAEYRRRISELDKNDPYFGEFCEKVAQNVFMMFNCKIKRRRYGDDGYIKKKRIGVDWK